MCAARVYVRAAFAANVARQSAEIIVQHEDSIVAHCTPEEVRAYKNRFITKKKLCSIATPGYLSLPNCQIVHRLITSMLLENLKRRKCIVILYQHA